jgi:molecular chaperone DnaK (HSP70)
MRRLAPMLVLLAGCGVSEPTARITVEANSPALSETHLIEPVGIETLGGVFTPLLDAGCGLPCETAQTFSTAEDNQSEISIALFRGRGVRAAENTRLGRFLIQDIPRASRGQPQIVVTMRAEETAIVLLARDATGGKLTLVRARE